MKVFITAGEASGDRLGADLMAGLKTLCPQVTFQGVGGPRMTAQGLASLFPMEDLSVMGLMEILPKYFDLKKRISQTAKAAVDWGADVVITVDAPEFSLRVANKIKTAAAIPTVHYVAPSVWAWRPGRADKMAAHVDHVLAVLPFEPPFMQAAGMTCDFVGHPVVQDRDVTILEISDFKVQHALDSQDILVALPGSRRSEVDRLMPVFADVMADPAFDSFRWVIPTLPDLVPVVEKHCAKLRDAPTLVTGDGLSADAAAHARRVAFAAAKGALAASGTVSLELASVGTPMVIAYDMKWLSRQIIGRMLRVDTVTLVNLVAETRDVPEFIGADCTPDNIARGLKAVLADPKAQIAAMRTTMDRLGRGGQAPGLRAAQSVLNVLKP